jgi:hypothetical protein
LIVDSASSEPVSWTGTLSLGWFRKFAFEFTSPWLESHGRHIKREHNRVFMLTFEADKLTVYYVLRDDVFENEQIVSLVGQQTIGESTAVYVLTKDFAVAAQAVADLSVVTAVEFAVFESMLTLRFATAAAQYQLHIPTCSSDGKRSTAGFSQYEPILSPLASESVENYYDPTDDAR